MIPLEKQLFTEKAAFPLKFVIVGGGIAGLACAYTLQCAGHTVRVLEKSDGLRKVTGGIRSPPNMTRLLLRWGLDEKLKNISTVCPCVAFRLGKTMEHLCSVYFYTELMQEFGANLLLMQHSDLLEMLYKLATESGVKVDFSSEVVRIEPHSPSVTLASGYEIDADIVIGADGGESLVRSVVVGECERESVKAGPFSTYFLSIPIESLEDDSELRELAIDKSWTLFLADGKCMLCHLTNGGKHLAVLLSVNDVKFKAQPGWDHMVPTSELDLSAFDPKLQRLARLVPFGYLTQHVMQQPLECWYHPSNKVLVLGEAAHLFNPGSSQGAAMAIEDATVLGSLFSRLRSPYQIPHFLSAFQELRHDRCQAVINSELSKVEFGNLPAGEHQEIRDLHLRKQGSTGVSIDDLDEVPENVLRDQCEEFREIYGYDADDDADNWWVQWGRLLEHSMFQYQDTQDEVGPMETLKFENLAVV